MTTAGDQFEARELAAAGLCRLPIEVRSKFGKTIDEEIRRIVCELVGAEAVSHATTPGSGIARRLHVHFRIAYEHGLLRCSAKIPQQNPIPAGLGFLLSKLLPP